MAHDDWNFEEARRAAREALERKPRRFPLGMVLAGALGLLILVVAGGLVYDQLIGSEDEAGPPPLVRAEEGPVKVRPEEPGGIEVPDQDKLVYDRLTGESAAVEPERLLPAPEEPSSAGEEMPEAAPSAEVGEEVAPEPEPVAGEEEEPSAQPVAEPAAETAEAPVAPPPAEPAPEATFAPERETETALAPAGPEEAPQPLPLGAPSAATEGGRYFVQLGAFRTEAAAERGWEQLRKAHPDLLGGLELIVERADLGPEKGVYFRARSGPFAAAAAKALCEKMKSRDVGCFVVKG